MMSWRYLGVGLIGIAFALLSSCASVATLKELPGQNVEIELTFNSSIDTSRYGYVVALSTQPILLPQQGKYLPLPGLDFSNDAIGVDNTSGTLSDYYANFFDTWTDFIIIGQSGVRLHQHQTGSYFPSAVTNNDHFSFSPDPSFTQTNAGATSGTVKITFPLNSLSIQPSLLYFAFFTLHNPYNLSAGATGRLISQVNSTDTVIQTIAITTKSGSVFSSPVQPGAEIRTWRIKVF